VTKAGNVVYVALEGRYGISNRLQAWQQHHNIQIPSTLRVVFEPLSLLQQSEIETFSKVVTDAGAGDGVVFIDTLNQSAPGADENSSQDMGRIISGAKYLQALTGSTVALIHHSGKDPSKGLRGHSSLIAALDVAIEIKNGNKRPSWELTKSKDSATGLTGGFTLQEVVIGKDPFGNDVSSCVVVPDHSHLSKNPLKPKGSNQTIALREINALLQQRPGGAQGPSVIQLDAAVAAVAAAIPCKPKHQEERALAAINGLVANELLAHRDGQLWLP
jgi:hypothetical protein